MKGLFIAFLLVLAGCATWIHPEGYDSDKLKEDKKACEATTQDQIKKHYGYSPCTEYAYEKGMERYGWSEGLTSTQRVPNAKDYKKALRECNLFQKAAFEGCMQSKGWKKQ